jgi:hypothetical protein
MSLIPKLFLLSLLVLPMAAQSPYGRAYPDPFTAKKIGPILQSDQFAGADASAKINACEAAASTSNGTCDARAFVGNQTMLSTITVLSGTTLLLPHKAVWCWGLTDGTSVGILQQGQSQIIGVATAGAGNQMLLQSCNSSTNMLALYATSPRVTSGDQGYVFASGFNAQNLITGALFSKGVIYWRNLFDESILSHVVAINDTGDAMHISGICCESHLDDVGVASTYGSAGGTPLVVESGASDGSLASDFKFSGTINAAGTGHPNIDILDHNGQIDFEAYAESGTGAQVDLTTPIVRVAANVVAPRFIGGWAPKASVKPCFNNIYLVESHGWCNGVDGNAVVVNAGATFNKASLYGLTTFSNGASIDQNGTIYTNSDITGVTSNVQDSSGPGGSFGYNNTSGTRVANTHVEGTFLNLDSQTLANGIHLRALNATVDLSCGDGGSSICKSNVSFQAPLFHETLTTPASSTAACSAGDFTDDASYHYVCTATNVWKRVALTTF